MQAYDAQPKRTSLPRSMIVARGRGRLRGLTLTEWMVVITITAVLLAAGTFAFRSLRENGIRARAQNAVITYANIARNYAIANHIETMLVVNPYNGRFEIWHPNPPKHGGLWDPHGTNPALADGYTYAPVLDSSAAPPRDGQSRPMASVHPVDYGDEDDSGTPIRSRDADDGYPPVLRLELAERPQRLADAFLFREVRGDTAERLARL